MLLEARPPKGSIWMFDFNYWHARACSRLDYLTAEARYGYASPASFVKLLTVLLSSFLAGLSVSVQV